ncbi:MAG TPA: HAMP domain-containing protein [Candidatus Limivivens intestinipullorum]|uniref:histidine kinase n=1 Tax=Candidatus Limivivens intestinipullorum TaxID=2840858 RepID=A0A9D1EVX2_9FIRM|nr:HAMP domain-containing protein [Candidatus Limivivens intestinipullorum]
MRKSLTKQIAMVFIGLMLLILFGNWLINSFFLEDYYVYKKQAQMVDSYEFLNGYQDSSSYATEDFLEELNVTCTENNIRVALLDSSFTVIYPGNEVGSILAATLETYLMQIDNSPKTILSTSDNYVIQKTQDRLMDREYMEIWGLLDNGCAFLLRMPLESIRENVRISSQFLLYFSILSILISVLLICWISRKITKPLKELTDLSKRMAELDFSAKYTSGGQNEIGQLGDHFNRMSESLETAVSELKTANNELQKDVEKKAQIDEMRKEFLSNVSHELKTPIALIQGYAEGLKECINDNDESRDFYCEVIMDEASKMNQMVKKLLTLNQLEFGNDTVTMERFDLTALIAGVVQSAGILAQQKGAQILFRETEPVYAWADEFKVEEVVTNYVSNALNHVDGDKVVDIKIHRNKDTVRVTVFNTGQPIPEEDLDKIWIKFYKVDKARTREYGGSGIGLSIVKAIMESFHQKCGVINYDNGVEFWFELDSRQEELTEREVSS